MYDSLSAREGEHATCRLADFDYPLPADRIAQVPAEERTDARLLVLGRRAGMPRHRTVRALPQELREGDVLVFNDTRVRPARLHGRSENGTAVEILLTREIEPGLWQALGKPAKRLRSGARLRLPGGVRARVEASLGGGRYAVRFSTVKVSELLERYGDLPLPPYIRRPDGSLPIDEVRYQTVFASVPGAVAAPTAGLHFDQELLQRLRAAGVETAWLTLHVGPATFLPVRHEDVRQHPMDGEWARIPDATAKLVDEARAAGRRVIAVGTTTTRALESAALPDGSVGAGERWADAFILPGHAFRVVDGLFTNFHLPKSTLLMLVSAFAGRERLLAAYRDAVRERYRFYSYGDAMLIL